VPLTSLAALVSLYALSAILYRTIGGSLTMNRLVVIGWNTINIALLLILVVKQLQVPRAPGWKRCNQWCAWGP
jgi:multisubunit Na+/H+ antiporter MnhF subunit